jgi:hypothetical protein
MLPHATKSYVTRQLSFRHISVLPTLPLKLENHEGKRDRLRYCKTASASLGISLN